MLTLKIIIAAAIVLVINASERICRGVKEFLISLCNALLPAGELIDDEYGFLNDQLH